MHNDAQAYRSSPKRLLTSWRGLLFGLIGLFIAGLASSGKAEETSPQGETWKNSIGMEFVKIPAGSFMRGKEPQHKVILSQPFYLGKYEVTQEQWVAVMGDNPSKFKGNNHPVENVSWFDAQEFINRLNQKEGTKKYRLPTEAEWEYAARAGTDTYWSFGNDASQVGYYAWYGMNSEGRTHPVGKKAPNPWGLYDMHGNVWEWVQDWYEEQNYYTKNPGTDPQGPATGSYRVWRGGSFFSYQPWPDLLSGYRHSYKPDSRTDITGFRIVRSLD